MTMDSIAARHPKLTLADAIHTIVIDHNRIRCDKGWDIDLDDGASNYRICNNLGLQGGIKLREGFHRTVVSVPIMLSMKAVTSPATFFGRTRGERTVSATETTSTINTMIMTFLVGCCFFFVLFLPFDFEVLDLVLINTYYSFSALFVEGAFFRQTSMMTLETVTQKTA